MKLKMFTDGGARGNPGPAAVGIIIYDEQGDILLEHSETIGEATNNIAEYQALLIGLAQANEFAGKQGKSAEGTELECCLDSELVVKQLKGEYKIKNYTMQKLYDAVRKAESQFRKISYAHLRRGAEGVRRADQLVNHALDEAERKTFKK